MLCTLWITCSSEPWAFPPRCASCAFGVNTGRLSGNEIRDKYADSVNWCHQAAPSTPQPSPTQAPPNNRHSSYPLRTSILAFPVPLLLSSPRTNTLFYPLFSLSSRCRLPLALGQRPTLLSNLQACTPWGLQLTCRRAPSSRMEYKRATIHRGRGRAIHARPLSLEALIQCRNFIPHHTCCATSRCDSTCRD